MERLIVLASSLFLLVSSSSGVSLDKIENPKIFRSSFALRRIPELTPRSYGPHHRQQQHHVPVYYGHHKRGGYTSSGGVYPQFNDPQYHEGGRNVRGRPPYGSPPYHGGRGGNKYSTNNHGSYEDSGEYERPPKHHHSHYGRYEDEKEGYREGYGDFEKDFGDYGGEDQGGRDYRGEDQGGRDYEVIYYKAQTSPDYDERGNLPEIVEYEDGRSVVLHSSSSEGDDSDEPKHVFDEDPGFGGRESEEESVKVSSSPIDSFGEFF